MSAEDSKQLQTAVTVKKSKSADHYLLMVRYGDDMWFPNGCDRDLAVVEKCALTLTPDVSAYRIVKLPSMPILTSDLEV